MAVVKQLYQLQELDLEIEAEEQALNQKNSQLGERQALDSAQNQLTSERKHLEELKRQQHSTEWELDDLMSKITTAEKQLYGGKINNPKELASLQQEINIMKSRSDQIETKALEIIDRVEAAEKKVVAANIEFRKIEDEWNRQQKQLSEDIAKIGNQQDDLKQKRQQLSEEIDASAVSLYEKLRKQKRPPVAKVEQGICRGCRISLSSSELQRARGGNAVQCGSCGRILFLP
ncbi:MAG: hypothetical protein A2144_04040 [Chloroflexi bacterium RBG_16_50_9]|nr:MAG: hypothetical protein A2144_04040 [Chloroflexi bacterium RBG_16_50_9]